MTENQRNQIAKLRAEGLGYGKIAQQLGMSLNTVKSYCRRKGVNGYLPAENTPVLSGEITLCENCGSTIQQISKQKKKRFCCDVCRKQWWNSHLDQVKRKAVYEFRCPHCGKEFTVYGDRRRKYCSHDCYIADRFKKGDGGDE